jgi:hypothetical protein
LRLPQSLLRVRRRRGRIRPLYASRGELPLAGLLISIYREHIDEKRWRLREALEEVEMMGHDPRLVRGLSAVLDSYCIYQMRSLIDPIEARRVLFKLTGGRGVTSEEERLKVLSEAASMFDVSPEDLDESLYADLEEEHHLADFEPPSPMELLREYNLSLTVSLLTHAESIDLCYRGLPDELEWLCQPLGRYASNLIEGEARISIKLPHRVRPSSRAEPIERLLRILLSMRSWSLWAVIHHPGSGKAYRFELIGERDGWLLPSRRVYRAR